MSTTISTPHDDCLFCKILKGEIPSDKVYEDESCYAFRDIHPLADTHILVIPREHIASVNEITPDNAPLVGHIFTAIGKIARAEGVAEKGYRVVSNCGKDAGQTVPHLHFHILAGKPTGELSL